jgi:signal transduction histidine kinase
VQIHDVQPILLVMIRNVTFKHDLKQLKNEMHFQNSLLKSFSHELRTPLNCSIQMLSIAKDLLEPTGLTTIILYIKYAIGSNFMLLYQMNDILDYAAMQCETF